LLRGLGEAVQRDPVLWRRWGRLVAEVLQDPEDGLDYD
jgi:hypothetical protein